MYIQVDELLADFRTALTAKVKGGLNHDDAIDAAWVEVVAPKLTAANETMTRMHYASEVPRHLGGRRSQFGR